MLVFEFAPHYEGPYKGQSCDSHRPPRSLFRNNQYCKPFVEFVRWSLDLWRPGLVSLAKVLNPFSACVSARFSSSRVADVTQPWHDINELKRVVCAFLTAATATPVFEFVVIGLPIPCK